MTLRIARYSLPKLDRQSLSATDSLLDSGQYGKLIDRIEGTVESHSRWIEDDCLSLVSAHNMMSPQVRAMLSSGLADKIMAGRIGKRHHAGAKFIDEIDSDCVDLARRLFHAEFVEYRPMSGSMANEIAIQASTRPGDTVAAWPVKYGAHYTFREDSAAVALKKLRVLDIPCTESEDGLGSIDFEAFQKLLERRRPSLIVLGSSTALFPYPVRKISEVARGTDAIILYDGAHVLGLIAGSAFQDPLREGATLLTGSTQKTIPGPVGGLVLSNDDKLGTKVQSCTDSLIANYQNNRIASLAIALIELLAFGKDLMRDTIDNARSSPSSSLMTV